MPKNVIFIEPNPFASRLHVLAPLIEGAIKSARPTHVLVQRREAGLDIDAFIENLPASAHISEIEFRRPTRPRARIRSRTLLKMLFKARQADDANATVVLTSPDDYISRLYWFLPLTRVVLKAKEILIIRYRVTDLLPDASLTVKHSLKKCYFSFLVKVLNLRTVVFDERITETQSTKLIPDPWSGPFGDNSAEAARKNLNWTKDAYIVGLIGKQDKRKGFPAAVKALTNENLDCTNLQVAVVGNVEAELHHMLDELVQKYGSNLHHFKRYLAEEEIADVFAACDVILLPYDISFSSTSGVLVRAAASRTPVISSSHGLVGWRTHRYGLGRTFHYDKPGELVNLLNSRPTTMQNEDAASEYVRESTASALSERFRIILSEEHSTE